MKAQIRSLDKTYELLTAANNTDTQNKQVEKLFKKIHRKDRSIDLDKMLQIIAEANEDEIVMPGWREHLWTATH